MREILAGLVHSLYYQIKRYFTRAGEEVSKVDRVYRTHRGNRVTLDAGDLHESADGVAGESEMMLKGNLGCVLNLIKSHLKELAKCRRRHRAGSTDLGLTATLCTADRCVGLGESADKSCNRKSSDDLLVGESMLLLHITKNRGEHGAGAAGWSSNDRAVIGILLADRVGVCTYDTVLSRYLALVDMTLIVKLLCLSLKLKSAGEHTRGDKSLVDRILHNAPNLEEKLAYSLTLTHKT